MLIFPLEKTQGTFCKFSVQNSRRSTAAIPRHFQRNWGRRPTLTFKAEENHRQLTWPWGLLCASQTRSDAAKEQERWKRQLKLQILLQSSPSKVGLEQRDRDSTGEGSGESRHNWLDEHKAESRWWSSQNQKLKPQLIKETRGEQMQAWLCWWTWKQLQEFWLCWQHNFISWLCACSHHQTSENGSTEWQCLCQLRG